MDLGRLVAYLNDFLQVSQFEESAINGLQVSGKRTVEKIAFAVDGVMESFERAAEFGADLLIVHHGIFWGHQWALRGPDYKRVKLLMDHEMALYAAHLPLDAHHLVGHAANLLRAIGVEEDRLEPFGSYKGQTIGYCGALKQCRREALTERLSDALAGSVRELPFGPEKVSRVACVTGQGADFGLLREAKIRQIHYYISGEANHPVYHFAQEHGLNVALGGHYATEVFGLHALEKHLRSQFDIDSCFINVPTLM